MCSLEMAQKIVDLLTQDTGCHLGFNRPPHSEEHIEKLRKNAGRRSNKQREAAKARQLDTINAILEGRCL